MSNDMDWRGRHRTAAVIGEVLTRVRHARDLLDELDGTDFDGGHLPVETLDAATYLDAAVKRLGTLHDELHDDMGSEEP